MMPMATMLILSIVMAVVYVAAVIIKDKVLPDSVSALVYALPKGRWRWLWSAWLAVVTLLMAPALMTAMTDSCWTQLLAAATIISLAMTAALPLWPGSHNRRSRIREAIWAIHYSLALKGRTTRLQSWRKRSHPAAVS